MEITFFLAVGSVCMSPSILTMGPCHHLTAGDRGRHATNEYLLRFCTKGISKGPPRVPLKIGPAASNVVANSGAEARQQHARHSNQTDSRGFLHSTWNQREQRGEDAKSFKARRDYTGSRDRRNNTGSRDRRDRRWNLDGCQGQGHSMYL